MKRRIYLDNTATTRTRREVVSAMERYFRTVYANPSSIHESGLIARGSLEMARENIAGVIGCRSEETVFTGSGSEANNTAIFGSARRLKDRGKHIITSPIEHSSILNACRELERQGFTITYLGVDRAGRFDLEQLAGSMRSDTILVTLGYVNNEIGTIQDVERIVRTVKERGVRLHLDAVQALPYIRMNLDALGVDLVSFSGHKLYAPKGIGILYVRAGTELDPLIYGGQQEFGLRSGTENVPYAVGLSRAVLLNAREKDDYVRTLLRLRDRLIAGVLNTVPEAVLTGDPVRRSPNHASFCFKGVNGKMLVKELSHYGIDASSGSACSSPRNDPSHVLLACGIPPEYLHGSLRLTLGRYTRGRDVERLLDVLPGIVERMRSSAGEYHNEPAFISQQGLRERLAAVDTVRVLDIRPLKMPLPPIPGSVPVPPWKLEKYATTVPRNTEIILVCYQGDILSPRGYHQLSGMGFYNVKVLKGGLAGYWGERRKEE